MNKKKIFFLVNNASSFISHRYHAYEHLVNNNNQVKLIIGKSLDNNIEVQSIKKLDLLKIDYIKLNFSSSNLNPLTSLVNIYSLIKIIIREKPDIIHSVALKPIVLAGIATFFFPNIKNIFAISGLGYIFTNRNINPIKVFILKFLFKIIFRIILINKNIYFIVQNNEDKNFVKSFKVSLNKIFLIPGCGININKFKPINFEQKKNIVLFPARLLRDKGLLEFVDAVNILKKEFPQWRFLVAGSYNSDNPTSLTNKEMHKLRQNPNLELLGYVNNMASLYKLCKIVCLPSYREGMPRSLQEAMASGCSIVTTNVPGCNEVIIDKYCGYLSIAKNSTDLYVKLKLLITNKEEIITFCNNARKLAVSRFEKSIIINSFYNIYEFIEKENKNDYYIVGINNKKFYLNSNSIKKIESNLLKDKKLIIIFGSSSFIGVNLSRYLSDDDIQILNIYRNNKNKNFSKVILEESLELLNQIFKITHSIIYLISKNKYKKTKTDINNLKFINNDMLLYIYKFAIKNKVKNFIYLSSIKVFGEENIGCKAYTLDDKPKPLDEYAKSKLEAENIIIKNAHLTTSYKILRIPLVYGKQIRSEFKIILFLAMLRIPIPLGNINNKRSFIDIDTLNFFIKKSIYLEFPKNKIFLLSDEKNYSSSEILNKIIQKNNLKISLFKINEKILYYVFCFFGFRKIGKKIFQDLSMDTKQSVKELNGK